MHHRDYPNTQLFIANCWVDAADRETSPIVNPATGQAIGSVAKAGVSDLEQAVGASLSGFEAWKTVSAYDRSNILRKAAGLLRERSQTVARLMTMEQGKPVGEAMAEVNIAADTIEWFAEEGRRAYGRIVPARTMGVQQRVIREPVGPVAVLTPWNFPLNQAAKKIATALAAGCTVVAKPAEEAPACIAELARAFADAGLPAGVLNLVFGDPAAISSHLIAHPAIRKISFTGSTAVGKKLAALAGQHMKRSTMELGGHAPVIVFDDADIEGAATAMAQAKFRNAGQVCISPTRFIVQSSASERFTVRFAEVAGAIRCKIACKVGPVSGDFRDQN